MDIIKANKLILLLSCVKGIGSKTIRSLINLNKINSNNVYTKKDILDLLKDNPSLLPKSVDKIELDLISKAEEKSDRILELLNNCNTGLISFFDKNYPSKFKDMIITDDYPVLLFYKGDPSLLNSSKICSVIGTRKPSSDIIEPSSGIIKKFVEKGFVICSGLALGCDSIGHSVCIESKGKTIAIMATGIDKIYPSENAELANQIIKTGGLLLTEELPSFNGAVYTLIKRDRLQAALADIVMVLQSSVIGGSMHTVKAAVKYKRKIFALKPKTYQGDFSGNQDLIDNWNAKPITSYDEI